MSNRKTIIAASILAILASGSVIAKGNDFHEDKWSQTKSYGQVLISDDSVDAWGPWGDFVEPAAGGTPVNPISMLGAGSNDAYRNLVNVSQIPALAASSCGAGDWCGYAIFANSTSRSGGRDERSYGGHHGDNDKRDNWIASLFSMTLSPDNPNVTAGNGSGNGSSFWRLTSLSEGVDPTFANSGMNMNTTFGGGTFSPEEGHWTYKLVKVGKNQWQWVPDRYVVDVAAGERYDNRDPGLQHLTASGENNTSGSASLSGFSQNANANEAANKLPDLSKYEKNYFEQAITGTEYKYTVREQRTITVHGRPFTFWVDVEKSVTVSADPALAVGYFDRVQNYVSGEGKSAIQTTETTRGYYVAGIATSEAYLSSQRAGNVSATYLGGSFDGSNQGKVQMTVNFQPGTWSGAWTDNGNFNFNASGTVSGANISGNVVNTKNLTGTVNGTFYGAQAGSIGGVSSVQNIKTAEVQNAIFVVNKVPTPSVQPK